jgi:hypothetical protein
LALLTAALGWLNYRATDDVQPVAAGLLVAGFGFSFWHPRLTWLFIAVLWLAIPVSGLVADANNVQHGLAKPHPLYETLVALIPAALGGIAGAATRWVVGHPRPGS